MQVAKHSLTPHVKHNLNLEKRRTRSKGRALASAVVLASSLAGISDGFLHTCSLAGRPVTSSAARLHTTKRPRSPPHAGMCMSASLEAAYSVLGVCPGQDFMEIKSRFRKLCLQYHPDVAGPSSRSV